MMFWLIAILMGLIASAFILAPMLLGRSRTYRDQRADINLSLYRERINELSVTVNPEEVTALELEAKKMLLADTADNPQASLRLVGDRRYSLAAALLVPVFALVVYADFGLDRGALPDVGLAQAMLESDPSDPAGYRYFIQQVEQRVEQRPDEPDLLFLLARGYANLGDYGKAATAYNKLLELFPSDPGLLSQYAETLYVLDERRFTPRVANAVDNALQANPHDTTMLEIRGIAAAIEGDIPLALTWLNRALQTGITGRREELIRSAIARLNNQAGLSGTEGATETAELTEASAKVEAKVPGRVLTVKVTAATSVDLPPGSAVFVYARAVNGPPAPLAVQRARLDQLPMVIRLDESMAMMPGMGLANFDQVVVIARVSASGQVTPAAGDYEVRSGALDLTGEIPPLELNITEPL
ncbi:MAG: c-type cytochrome biogenesis protein CcmI [Pseudomonadales bacterium]|nr:c-type cytochrome biogenesis protein CcmI [Pseudomonadales bacterium]